MLNHERTLDITTTYRASAKLVLATVCPLESETLFVDFNIEVDLCAHSLKHFHAP